MPTYANLVIKIIKLDKKCDIIAVLMDIILSIIDKNLGIIGSDLADVQNPPD